MTRKPESGTTIPTSHGTFVVWHKAPGRGSRWRKLAVTETHAQAVALVADSALGGDFWIATVINERLAGASVL